MRRSEAQTSTRLDSLKSGSEGYADSMGMFPRLKEWENQIALKALRERKSVDDLHRITPFRQYLEVDRRYRLAGEISPFSSFTTLFDRSPSIDLLVSFGNFHSIRRTTQRLARGYTTINLPLDQFLQDALLNIAPYSARKYNGSIGNPFDHYLTVLLERRFLDFVTKHQFEMTSPIQSEEVKHKGSHRRVKIASLDMQMSRSAIPQTLFEFLETTQILPEDTTHADDEAAKEKIHILSQLAGLNEKQEETLIALYIYGGNTPLIAKLRRTTTRSVRGQRQTALESIQQLGYETVSGILTGSTPR